MPKAHEDKLKRQAEARGLRGDDFNAYVYGTLRKTGWKPQKEEVSARKKKRKRRRK